MNKSSENAGSGKLIHFWFKGDPVIWGVVFVLAVLSVWVVYSSAGSLAYRSRQGNTEYYLFKHLLLTLISLVVLWGSHRIDYRYYAGLSKLALWVSVPLLLVTWCCGVTFNEASRWLTIPVVNKAFQPSDLAQIALIMNVANVLAKVQYKIDDWQRMLVSTFAWCGVISGLIALTNLSAALLLFLTCVLLMYIGGLSIRHLVILLAIGLIAGSVALQLGQRGMTALGRLRVFFQNELPFQTEQSYIAIATGGVYGKGPGNSHQRNFLPYPYSDFIYAVIVEEYGLVGGVVVVLLYLVLLYRSIRNLSKDTQVYGSLLAAGLGFYLVLQAIVNMGVTTGLSPVTGLPLPFVSMGGTSMLSTAVAVGIILSVSRGEVDTSIGQIQGPKMSKNQYRKS